MTDVWTVVGLDSGLRRIEQAPGGPVVHYIDAAKQGIQVVLEADHVAALAAFAEHEGCDAAGLAEGYDAGRADALRETREIADHFKAVRTRAAIDVLITQTSAAESGIAPPSPDEAGVPSVAPAGEDHGAPAPCVCWLCRDLSLACEACENCVIQAKES